MARKAKNDTETNQSGVESSKTNELKGTEKAVNQKGGRKSWAEIVEEAEIPAKQTQSETSAAKGEKSWADVVGKIGTPKWNSTQVCKTRRNY